METTQTPTVESTSRKMGLDGRAVKVTHFNAWICRCKCRAFRSLGSEVLIFMQSFRGPSTRCIECGAQFTITQVRGVLNAAHKCGARCLNAKGGDCECACGGLHHGGK